jgi:hypothetical protein
MPALEIQQRCWNHEAREAACRCMACARSYCRECVAEHEGRLICAACLAQASAKRAVRRGGMRRLAPAALIIAGLLMAWLAYWMIGAFVITIVRTAERNTVSTGRMKLPA